VRTHAHACVSMVCKKKIKIQFHPLHLLTLFGVWGGGGFQEWVLKMSVWWLHASISALFFPRENELRSTWHTLLCLYEIGLVVLPELVEILQIRFLPGTCVGVCACVHVCMCG